MSGYFVYILHSASRDKYYIGTTDNVDLRLEQHNTGFYKKGFTTKGIPWVLMMSISCNSSKQAYQVERYIKSRKSVKYIQKLIQNTDLHCDLLNRISNSY